MERRWDTKAKTKKRGHRFANNIWSRATSSQGCQTYTSEKAWILQREWGRSATATNNINSCINNININSCCINNNNICCSCCSLINNSCICCVEFTSSILHSNTSSIRTFTCPAPPSNTSSTRTFTCPAPPTNRFTCSWTWTQPQPLYMNGSNVDLPHFNHFRRMFYFFQYIIFNKYFPISIIFEECFIFFNILFSIMNNVYISDQKVLTFLSNGWLQSNEGFARGCSYHLQFLQNDERRR